jgi:1,4-alpha-glucan branching enzyme
MGAIPHVGGVVFRVWAPHAQRVAVIGSFNGWDGDKCPMQAEENGTWYADVAEARVGDEYRFLLAAAKGNLARIDPYAREVTHSVGNAIVHDPSFDWESDDFSLAPWNELVIYELHVGTFNEEEDDNLPGEFDSASARLGHLKKLGINAIHIMPVAQFAGERSWGYNPSHIFSVEMAYGGPLAFKRFVKRAHNHGIAVILDVVYNHLGPSDLDLWQFDGWSENNLGGIYFYNDDRAKTPWGDTRPDYGRGEVRQFILDNVTMWLEEYHVDGLRFDGTVYIRTFHGPGSEDLPEGWGLLQAINSQVVQRYPGRITIAEDLQNNEWLTGDVGAGGAGFGSQWDANFVHPIRQAVTTPQDEQRSLVAIRDALSYRYNDDAFARVIYSESHDEVANGKARVPQEVDPNNPKGWYARKRSTLAAAMVFTAPGIPMLFQGQEFLEGEWFRDTVPLET